MKTAMSPKAPKDDTNPTLKPSGLRSAVLFLTEIISADLERERIEYFPSSNSQMELAARLLTVWQRRLEYYAFLIETVMPLSKKGPDEFLIEGREYVDKVRGSFRYALTIAAVWTQEDSPSGFNSRSGSKGRSDFSKIILDLERDQTSIVQLASRMEKTSWVTAKSIAKVKQASDLLRLAHSEISAKTTISRKRFMVERTAFLELAKILGRRDAIAILNEVDAELRSKEIKLKRCHTSWRDRIRKISVPGRKL